MNKKIITIAIIPCLLLSGCGGQSFTEEEIVNSANEFLENLDYIDADININFDMSMKYKDSSTDSEFKMDTNIKSDFYNGLSYSSSKMSVEILGQSMNVKNESYTEKTEDGYEVYSYSETDDEDGEWEYTKTEQCGFFESGYSVIDIYDTAFDDYSDFIISDNNADINGTKCYAVTGNINRDTFEELLSKFGLDDFGIDMDLSESVTSATCYFEKDTLSPKEVDFECNNVSVIDSDDYEIDVDSIHVSTICNSFEKEEISIPDSVKEDTISSKENDKDNDKNIDEENITDEDSNNEDEQEENIEQKDEEDSEQEDESEEPIEQTEFGDVMVGKNLDSINGLTTFSLNGCKYNIGGHVNAMFECGWEEKQEQEEEDEQQKKSTFLHPGETRLVQLVNGESCVSLSVINTSSKETQLEECTIYGISVYADNINDFSVENGINTRSTYEEVEDIIGQYTECYPGTSSNYYWITPDSKFTFEITYNKNNEITYISISDDSFVN